MFWNGVYFKPLGENRISIKYEDHEIISNIQAYFANTKITAKPMDNEDKLTVFNILEKREFYSLPHNKGLNSARKKDVSYNLPKATANVRSPPLQQSKI